MPNEALFEAAQSGDLSALSGADRSELEARKQPYAWTLLHIAAASGQLAAVDLLLERGLDVDARETGDHTYAMHWAAAEGHLDVVQRLADAGGDVVGSGDDHALEVIGWATCWGPCHDAVAEFLLSRGARHHIFSAIAMNDGDEVRAIVAADPGALHRRMSRNEDHQLPLHFAVRRHRPEMVALLIELGADPLGVDGSGHNVAAYATSPDVDRPAMEAIHGMTEAELLSATRGQRAPNGRPIDVIAALAVGDRKAAAQLVGAIVPGVLHQAAKRNDAAAVRWLLARGADPDARWSHWGAEVTPLHLASAQGHTEVMRLLLEAGADSSARDTLHDSDSLGWARFFEQPEAVALLEAEPDRAGEPISVVLECHERDAHLREILDSFENGWVVGITSRAGLVRLDLETPGVTWGAAVSLVEDRLDRLPFDWRSHAACRRP